MSHGEDLDALNDSVEPTGQTHKHRWSIILSIYQTKWQMELTTASEPSLSSQNGGWDKVMTFSNAFSLMRIWELLYSDWNFDIYF